MRPAPAYKHDDLYQWLPVNHRGHQSRLQTSSHLLSGFLADTSEMLGNMLRAHVDGLMLAVSKLALGCPVFAKLSGASAVSA